MEGVTVHYARRIEDVLEVALPMLKAKSEIHSVPAEVGTSAAA
jgi:hypothetical protein